VSDRLFFALWPDDRLREALAGRVAEWTRDYPCKLQRADQWHLTVEFIGSVEAARQPALHQAAATVAGCLSAPEEIVLDRLEHWERPQVLCVAAQAVPPRVAEWVLRLRAALAERGFAPERREFLPHLTLARKARQPVAARRVEPIRWPVGTLWLVKSHSGATGSRYEPCACWNLVQTLGPAR
jgi:2'-5' RNA ligase